MQTTERSHRTIGRRFPWRVTAMLAALALPQLGMAGEGGVSHILPGANATLVDVPPTSPGWFVKPMYLNYDGDASARIPTAAGVVANMHANVNTFIVGGGYGFDGTVLGGAHYDIAAFLPYSWISVSGDTAALGGRQIQNSVSGLGDLTVVPVMLAWKSDNWQYDFLMPVYAPTGSYEVGRLGNPGLNYWTVDPIVGLAYSDAKSGLNAAVHMGYAFNSENNDTSYKSGDILHIDASIQQILPLGSGYANIGAEAWYFQQATCDSGAGATLGCFKGMTSGIGPVLGYIQPIGQETLLIEFKWLPELDTKNRLNGDYLWLKMVYKF
jgi:hypothetical protein